MNMPYNQIFLLLLVQLVHSQLTKFSVPAILEIKRLTNNEEGTDSQKKKSPILSGVEESYIEQKLDHFASHPRNTSKIPYTFFQRYFYSSKFISKGKRDNDYLRKSHQPAYVFLCVGGEGPSLDKSVLVDSVHCSGDMLALASILHTDQNADVHVFALEHRYYGESYPKFNDESSPVLNENLVYLSSRQALSDLATFVQRMNEKYSLDDQVKWVTFGGSYPGMLAAWARLKFPHLIYAAVSNSAPVEVKLDFAEYKSVVANDLKNEDIGGSEECLQIISRGHAEIEEHLKSDSEAVAEMFCLCDGAEALAQEKNVQAWLGDGVIDIPAQGNDPNCIGYLCNIEKVRVKLLFTT